MIHRTLTVITPSMRTLRLPNVAASIAAAPVPTGWNLRWLVGYNPPWALPWGEHIKRWDDLLNSVTEGFWIIVADDNLLDSRLPAAVAEHVDGANDVEPTMILFAQLMPQGTVRTTSPDSVNAGEPLDGGQVVMNAKWFRGLGFSYDAFGPERFLVRHLFQTSPATTLFDNRSLTMYDAQRNLA